MLLSFLTFSALVANPKKTTLHGGQSRSWSAEQGKKKKKKVWQRLPPPPPARCSFGEKIKNEKSRDASSCLGATKVGVTQVVSVRLASVQGFLRLVSSAVLSASRNTEAVQLQIEEWRHRERKRICRLEEVFSLYHYSISMAKQENILSSLREEPEEEAWR